MTQESSNHQPYLSTLRSKWFSCSKMKWWDIYTNLPVKAIARLPHPQSGESQGQETFLSPSTNKLYHNYDTGVLKHHPSLSTLTSKGLSRTKMKWWAIYANLLVNAIVRLPYPESADSQGQKTFSTPSADKQTRNYETRVLKPPSIPISAKVKGIEP